MKLIYLVMVLSVLGPSFSWGLNPNDRQFTDSQVVELLDNPGFESGLGAWTPSSSSTFTKFTSNPFFGTTSARFTASASGQTIKSKAYTVPVGLQGQACQASIKYTSTEATNFYKLSVVDGSANTLGSTTLNTTSQVIPGTVSFLCPSSGTVQLQITSSGTAAALNFDNAHLGSLGLIQAAQAKLLGTVTFSGCSASWNTTTSTVGPFSVQTGCTYSVTGSALAPTTNIPGIRFATLPAGEYLIQYDGEMYAQSSSGVQRGFFQFSDGTNFAREIESIIAASAGSFYSSTSMNQSISYGTAQSNITLQVYGSVTTSGSATAGLTAAVKSGTIKVYYFPAAQDQLYSQAVTNWQVDANLAGAATSLGTTSSASGTAFTDLQVASGLALTNNGGRNAIPAQLTCAGTNAPTGTTCSSTADLGISFTPPVAGDVEVCAQFTDFILNSASSQVFDTFQIVQTPINAQTISAYGGERPSVGNATASSNISLPVKTCSRFTLANSNQVAFRLFFNTTINGTPSGHQILTDQAIGNRDMRWTVRPVATLGPALAIPSTVATNSSNGAKLNAAQVTSTGSVISQIGSWVSSVTQNSTGNFTVSFAAGEFSSAPTCTCMVVTGNAPNTYMCNQDNTTAASTTLMRFQCSNTSNTGVNCNTHLICMGPK